MSDRTKQNNVIGLLLLVIMAMVCWVAVQPQSQAQPQYGPNVTSELKCVDAVYKTVGISNVIPATAGKRFRILALFVRSNSSTANNVYFVEQDNADTMFGTNSTDVETLDQVAISGKIGWVNNSMWRDTEVAGKALQISLSQAERVSVMCLYVEIE
jgi:preprotein translocase subunit YajC